MEAVFGAIETRLSMGRFTQVIERFQAEAGIVSGPEIKSQQAICLAKLTSDVLYQLFNSNQKLISILDIIFLNI